MFDSGGVLRPLAPVVLREKQALRPQSISHLREQALRRRLGIPEDAEKVLFFAESSHWDPNWLHTSEEYYAQRIQHIFDDVIRVLEAEPSRVYSVEGVFFLRMFWERAPDRRAALVRLMERGQLRLSATGITSPDTVLPNTEAIVRDFAEGQRWLDEHGLPARPRIAYLPDDFGYTPEMPAILSALGVDKAGITRVDGMHFIGSDYRLKSAFPLPGSSAELLQNTHRSADFVWRASDGSEVLTHWNAFSYFQGDMLAHLGVIRWMGKTYGFSWRGERHVARQMRRFTRQLAALSQTPYLLCPIGCDFNSPIADLTGLLTRYNRSTYPDTGTYTVSASMEDYLELVDCHRDELPVLELDINPYWMGFYATRPWAKATCNRVTDTLVRAEKLAVLGATNGHGRPRTLVDSALRGELDEAWDLLIVANHHDFITGTSPDRVWEAEQRPWLERAEALANDALARTIAQAPPAPPAPLATAPTWELDAGCLRVSTPHYRLELREDAGGCITSLCDAAGNELLAGPANDLVAYKDSGGLWRLGHEFAGGTYRVKQQASQLPATLEAELRDGILCVTVRSTLSGRPLVRTLWMRADRPELRMRVEGAAAPRRSIACRFPTALASTRLSTDVPGGVAQRPGRKLYDPTYWPVRSFAHITNTGEQRGLAAFVGGPGCVGLVDDGSLEWVFLRNAKREVAWGILPVLAHPASGTDHAVHVFDYAVRITGPGDWRANGLHHGAAAALGESWLCPGSPDYAALAELVATPDSPDVLVTAVKPAADGEGLVLRLQRFDHALSSVRVRLARPVTSAHLCDANERLDAPLSLEGREGLELEVPLERAITSVYLCV